MHKTAPEPASGTSRKPNPKTSSHECLKANDVLSLIGDKWSVHIVMVLGGGRPRFMDIKRAVDGISQKMLTTTLRGLERDGYVTRDVYPTIPPRVEYELTTFGEDLLPRLKALGDWAIDNRERVLDARRRFEDRQLR